MSGLELGGLLGSLVAGRWSDAMIKANKTGEGGAVGKRVQVRATASMPSGNLLTTA